MSQKSLLAQKLNFNHIASPVGSLEQQFYENLIDKKQLAGKLSISLSYINKLMVKGMPRVNIGRAVRFRFSEVIAFLERAF